MDALNILNEMPIPSLIVLGIAISCALAAIYLHLRGQ